MPITLLQTHLLCHAVKGLWRQLEPGRWGPVAADNGPHVRAHLEGKDNMADHQQEHWGSGRDTH